MPTLPYLQALLFVQMFALEKSMQMDIPTDTPCVVGEVNRVVQGVTIYPLS